MVDYIFYAILWYVVGVLVTRYLLLLGALKISVRSDPTIKDLLFLAAIPAFVIPFILLGIIFGDDFKLRIK